MPVHRRQLVVSGVVLLALLSIGMIVAGMLDRPAEPSWATPQPGDDPDRTATAPYSVSASPSAPASPSATGSPSPARTSLPARKLSAKPSPRPTSASPSRNPTRKPPASTSPTRQPAPTPTATSPQIAQLLADCSPEGARAETRSGIPLACRTRPWDPELRWRLA
ncbi:hypothetical protein [Actinoplanes sp. GCM10030250]|uniref:hypothetical protein n=1 Tax=Actinoplanes sp. GCM10030250 TaxID=3273376 RepID=UPI003622CF18